ncbi:hypothetical protein CK221_29140 [Mesorhizobium sp. WSM3868]|nr:hypothetical protein CK221_29140 [Mesorhizobium sp. WSM3868]
MIVPTLRVFVVRPEVIYQVLSRDNAFRQGRQDHSQLRRRIARQFHFRVDDLLQHNSKFVTKNDVIQVFYFRHYAIQQALAFIVDIDTSKINNT